MISTIALEFAGSMLISVGEKLAESHLDKLRERVFWHRLFEKVFQILVAGYEEFEESEHTRLLAIDERFFKDPLVRQMFTERVLVGDVDRDELRDRYIELYGENQAQLFERNLDLALELFYEQLDQSLEPGERSAFAKLQIQIQSVDESINKTIQESTDELRAGQAEMIQLLRSIQQEVEPSSSHVQQVILLIVTVTKVEAQAVLDIFSGDSGTSWERHQIEEKTYYNLGFIGGVPVYMVRSEMGSGTPSGSIVTVLRDLNPQAVIMCGIAFGLQKDKQELGDILISQKLEYYESQKVDYRKGQISRGDRITASGRLLDRFRGGEIDWRGAKTHFGLFLSGEKLVNDPLFRDSLKKMGPEAIGGDMEGSGLYTAARDAGVEWIVVKAICDWADGSKNDNVQSMAAHNAAQFVLHVVKLGGWV
jgi:nucleoside phosphorylase